ncbi:unnamed protein product [Oikopleura dioica]|uniref:Uncharacterized protein n=1 Tax=Oikopleura dioica TaxID=34765 RepID=E4XCJ3_OIKDI|nr:unnamed protein product [Oikopleura dioica]
MAPKTRSLRRINLLKELRHYHQLIGRALETTTLSVADVDADVDAPELPRQPFKKTPGKLLASIKGRRASKTPEVITQADADACNEECHALFLRLSRGLNDADAAALLEVIRDESSRMFTRERKLYNELCNNQAKIKVMTASGSVFTSKGDKYKA